MWRRNLLLLLILPVCLWQVADAATNTGTLLVGVGPVTSCGRYGNLPSYWGFTSSPAVGSYSPTGLTGGKAVVAIVSDDPLCGAPYNVVIISGFSANPGVNWFTSITCNGVTIVPSGGTYTYGGGRATWIMGSSFGLQLVTTTSCTIAHK